MAQAKMTPEEIRNSDPFLAGDEIHLDLSAYPHLSPLADAPIDDEQFAPIDSSGMGVGSSALKRFLDAPDREAIEGLRDPELLKKYDEEHGDGTTVYASNIPFQVYQRGGKWRAKGTTPDGQLHRFTADTRDGLFPKISAVVSENTVRELTDSERLQVVRQAQSGDPHGAIRLYLEFSIGQRRASSYQGVNELLADPRLAEVFDDCSMLTWFASRPKVEDSDEFQEFLQRYRGGRPLNHDLLDGAYQSFIEKNHRLVFAPIPGAPEATPVKSLDDLSDAEINSTYESVARAHSRWPGGRGFDEASAVAVHA